MRLVALIAAAGIAFTTSAAVAQQSKDLTGETYTRHTCDCRKITKGNAKRWPDCMRRRLGYVVDASTAANVVCPDPKAKGKKKG